MKQMISLLLILGSFNCFSQAGGNALFDRNNNPYYNQSAAPGVDLNLENRGYAFSNTLEANVMINVKASSYVAIFSLSQQGRTVDQAEAALTSRIEGFKKMLAGTPITGVPFVDPVSMVPTYEMDVVNKKLSRTFNEVPTGFEIKKNIHITFQQHEVINRLISIAAQAEIYELVKVEYVIENMDEVLNGIRTRALAILLNKKTLIENTGLHIRLTQVGEKYGSSYPFERYAEYTAYRTGVSPMYLANYKKGQTVQYNYSEHNKTLYYEKVSDKQFDQVINAVVSEPVIQVYLSLKAQYQVYDPVKEAEEKDLRLKSQEINLKEQELNLESKLRDIEPKDAELGKRRKK